MMFRADTWPSAIAQLRESAIPTRAVAGADGRGDSRGGSRRKVASEYANFGAWGRTTREIKDEQLAPALALEPDLVTCFSGTNDVIRPRFDLNGVLADMHQIH